MNCSECQESFSELYDGTLGRELTTAAEAHLASCAGCRREYDVYRAGLLALTTTASIEAPERFVEAVSTTLHIQKVAPPPPPAAAPPVPRRAVPWWIPVTAAAVLVLVFASGFLISSLSHKLGQMQEELARLRDRKVEPPPVQTSGGREANADEIIAQWIAKQGLVKYGSLWVRSSDKERLDKGEAFIKGEWKNVQEEIDRLKQEIAAARTTPNPTPPPTEAELLEEFGLVKYDKWYVPRDWADKLKANMIRTDKGEWVKADDFVAQIMAEHRLVQHAGRWMTEEQRSAILAQQEIRRPSNSTLDPVTARALEGLQIGPPMGFGNLTLYPLIATGHPDVTAKAFHEAFDDGQADVADGAGALAVRVKNDSADDVLVFAGTVLVGGRCGRVVAHDTLVPVGKTVDVRVCDAEPSGGLRSSERFAKESGQYLVTPSLRRLLAADAGQGAVWNTIASQLTGIKNGTGPADLYKAYATSISEYRASLDTLRVVYPGAVGVAVSIGDRLEYVDVFATPDLFGAHYERLLAAAALEAAIRRDQATGGNLPNTPSAVKKFIESVFMGESEPVENAIRIRLSATGVTAGRAFVSEDVALHVALFVESNAPEPRAAQTVNAAKLQVVLADYEKRFENAVLPLRPAILREMGSLPGKRTTTLLIAHLQDPESTVRQAAVTELGRRSDADAVKPLIKVLKEAKRDLPVFGATAEALARLGAEEAVGPMLDVLEGKDAIASQIVADQIPSLLQQQKNDQVVERAIGRMIDALETLNDRIRTLPHPQLEPDTAYQGVLTAALRSTTSKSFTDAIEWRRWWNDPTNRRKFIEERSR